MMQCMWSVNAPMRRNAVLMKRNLAPMRRNPVLTGTRKCSRNTGYFN